MKQMRVVMYSGMVSLLLLGGCAGKNVNVEPDRGKVAASGISLEALQAGDASLNLELEAQEEIWRDMNRELRDSIARIEERLSVLEQSNQDLKAVLAKFQHKQVEQAKKKTHAKKPKKKAAKHNGRNPLRNIEHQKELYTHSYLELKKGRYADAVKGFSKYLIEFPDGKYANLTHFWLGEAYYASGDITGAVGEFSRVKNTVESRDKHARALWRKVQIAQQQGKQDDVLRNAQLLISAHPTSPEAGKVKKLLRGVR